MLLTVQILLTVTVILQLLAILALTDEYHAISWIVAMALVAFAWTMPMVGLICFLGLSVIGAFIKLTSSL